MSSLHIDPSLVVLVVLTGLGALVAFRSGARSGYKVARHIPAHPAGHQDGRQPGPGAGHRRGDRRGAVGRGESHYRPSRLGVVSGVPALFAGAAIARLFSVTELLHAPERKRGRR
jgi:hypothetical protein